MKSLSEIQNFLLPHSYHRYGLMILITGVPIVLLMMTVIVFNIDEPEFKSFWDYWGGYLLHAPLSLGLFWMLFAKEKEEDEMYLMLRLKATFHGIRFIFIAILFLPGLSMVWAWYQHRPIELPDIGGNLAVVTLLLAYAYGAYWWMKKKQEQDEE